MKDKFCISKKLIFLLFFSVLLLVLISALKYLNNNNLSKNPKASTRNLGKKAPKLMACGGLNQPCCAGNYCNQDSGTMFCIGNICRKEEDLFKEKNNNCSKVGDNCCITEKTAYSYKLGCKGDLKCTKEFVYLSKPDREFYYLNLKGDERLNKNLINRGEIEKALNESKCIYDEKKVCGSLNQPCCGDINTPASLRCTNGTYCFTNNISGYDIETYYNNICKKISNENLFFDLYKGLIAFDFSFPVEFKRLNINLFCNRKSYTFDNYNYKTLGQRIVIFDNNTDLCDIKKIIGKELYLKVVINAYDGAGNVFYTRTVNKTIDLSSVLDYKNLSPIPTIKK